MSDPAPRLRRIRPEDWRELRRARLAALAGDPAAFASLHDAEAGKEDGFWQARAALGASSATDATWVAVDDDGRILGTAGLSMYEGRLLLLGVWIDPALRGTGLSRSLLAELFGWSSVAHPGEPIHLHVNPRLAPAVGLYRSLGFVETGEEGPLRDGSLERRVGMVRRPG